LAINLRKPQIEAYKQRTFHAIDYEVHEPVARRQPSQIALGAESLIVSVNNLAIGTDKIQAVVRLIRLGQSMRTSQNDPQAQLPRKCHNLLGLFLQQQPIVLIE